MNVRHMECFRAAMTAGSFTGAAALLGVSQPAVSGMIRALEHELGFALFSRLSGRMRATPEAHYLFQDIERTLGSLERTVQTARAIRNRTHGRLVVASYPGIALEFLPMVVAEFLAGRPDVRVELHSRSSHVIHELIPAQRFDVAIAELPANQRGVHSEPLTLECVCVLPEGHALAERETLTPADLDNLPFISLFGEHIIHYQVARAFAAANAHWNVVAETRFFATNCAFAALGTGVSIVDPITASDYAGRGIVARRFRPRIPFEIGLLYPTERPRARILDALVAVLKRHLQPYLVEDPGSGVRRAG